MKDGKIIKKTIKGLLKRGYKPDKVVITDIYKSVEQDSISSKRDPDYILGLVCDYGFYLGMQETQIRIPLN